mmetsp:Transcript_41196/g.129416  ORF Transcript_41196/g.129416 Transcript_41196/m.129416 type:complete len:108 (-) Transcript_41196:124-447(-)
MLTAIARAQDDAGSISLPYILFHGSGERPRRPCARRNSRRAPADHITNPDGSERFHKNTSSSSKEFVPIEGGYHEVRRGAGTSPAVSDMASSCSSSTTSCRSTGIPS